MATIDNNFGNGVTFTAPIDLGAKKPLDSRIAVNTIAERDAHVSGNRAFPGMQVYVTADDTTYVYKGEGASPLWEKSAEQTWVNNQILVNSVKVNGSALTPSSKAVDIKIEESSSNGKLKVNGSDVAIHGLDTSAYLKVANNLTTETSDTHVLDAYQGKVLAEKIESLEGRGRYLSVWQPTLGLPTDNPPESSLVGGKYYYRSGDYFIIGTVGEGTKYKPDGSYYTPNVASTVVTTDNMSENDYYIYDGTNWRFVQNTTKTVTFAQISGEPTSNAKLKSELDAKATTTALSNEVARATGVEATLTSDIENLETDVEDLSSNKLDKNQTVANKGKTLVVGDDGNLTTKAFSEIADSTLSTTSDNIVKNSVIKNALDAEASARTGMVVTTLRSPDDAEDTKVLSEKALLNNFASLGSDPVSTADNPIDADTLGGLPASNYATASSVSTLNTALSNEITRATTAENGKVNISQGVDKAGYTLKINDSGNVVASHYRDIADSNPTENSENIALSGGIYTAIKAEETRATAVEATKVPNTLTINNHDLKNSFVMNCDEITMYGYEKATEPESVLQIDTVNVAIGKIEKKVDDAVASTLADSVIVTTDTDLNVSHSKPTGSTTVTNTLTYKNQDPNKVLAGPSTGSAQNTPSFRSLVEADIPALSISKVTSLQSSLDAKATTTALSNEVTRATNAENAKVNISQVIGTEKNTGKILVVDSDGNLVLNTFAGVADSELSTESDNVVKNSTIATKFTATDSSISDLTNNKVDKSLKINGSTLTKDLTLDGLNLVMTGYVYPSSTSAITPTDTIDNAIGKLEYKADSKANTTDLTAETQARVNMVETDIDATTSNSKVYSTAVAKSNFLLTAQETVTTTTTGIDADTLDGNHASYFGTASDVSTLQTNLSSEITRATTAENSKVSISQGTEQSGRILKVNSSGNLALASASDICDSSILVGSINPVQSSAIKAYVDAETTRATNAEASRVATSRKINNITLTDDITINGTNITMTDYVKPSSTSAIQQIDTLNTAIGKLEKGLESATSGGITKIGVGNQPDGFTFTTGTSQGECLISLDYNNTVTKNMVIASPANEDGKPTFRVLSASDIPSLTKSKISDLSLVSSGTDTTTMYMISQAQYKSILDRLTALENAFTYGYGSST